MSLLYYGLAVVGTAAIILAVYNLIIFKRCGGRRSQSSPSSSSSSSSQFSNRATETAMAATRSCDIRLNRNSTLSSYKYKKESEQDCDCDSVCPVCLSGFEEGEEVTKLPRCKHRFHALCIDMWLYSHFDCPICRTPVLQFCQLFPPPASSGEEGLLRSAINGAVAA
ncbi:hypothetical protein QN277_000402 [Acacia crassicarpa]|nr:hypothetical protein QN277_000402 [Acacia crassicarpa]